MAKKKIKSINPAVVAPDLLPVEAKMFTEMARLQREFEACVGIHPLSELKSEAHEKMYYGVPPLSPAARQAWHSAQKAHQRLVQMQQQMAQQTFHSAVNAMIQGGASDMQALMEKKPKPAPKPDWRRAFNEARDAHGPTTKGLHTLFILWIPIYVLLWFDNSMWHNLLFVAAGLFAAAEWALLTRNAHKNQELAYFTGRLPERPMDPCDDVTWRMYWASRFTIGLGSGTAIVAVLFMLFE